MKKRHPNKAYRNDAPLCYILESAELGHGII